MVGSIFISYRRHESEYQALRFYETLKKLIPGSNIFLDRDGIRLGENLRMRIEDWVSKCDIMFALITKGWLESVDRLQDEQDLVRFEVSQALRRNIPVVPVLLDGARMPGRDSLPGEMAAFPYQNGGELQFRTFESDVATMIDRMRIILDHENEMRSQGRIRISVGATTAFRWIKPGGGRSETDVFQDVPEAPEMVLVPDGSFEMGTQHGGEPGRSADEGPCHLVRVDRPLAVSRYAVTRGQFNAFVRATGYAIPAGARVWSDERCDYVESPRAVWNNPGFEQDDNHPVVCVNLLDALTFAVWLSGRTGHVYRLLSEAEWEYVARAGTRGPFWWGNSIGPDQANYDGRTVYNGGGQSGPYRRGTVPVNEFEANPWGLYGVHGNVWEWCSDRWNDRYQGAPADGSPWLTGDKKLHIMRGGGWNEDPEGVRSAMRGPTERDIRYNNGGFRLARSVVVAPR